MREKSLLDESNKGIFSKLKKLSRKVFRRKADESLKWFFNRIKKEHSEFGRKSIKKVSSPNIGSLVHFIYSAKHKETLPYWDAFPLAIIFSINNDSFLGLNLHYLPVTYRVQILKTLRKLKIQKADKRKYVNLSYTILKSAINNKYIKQCIKMYLASHVKSDIIEIGYEDWEEVVYLPTQQFKKASAEEVWSNL